MVHLHKHGLLQKIRCKKRKFVQILVHDIEMEFPVKLFHRAGNGKLEKQIPARAHHLDSIDNFPLLRTAKHRRKKYHLVPHGDDTLEDTVQMLFRTASRRMQPITVIDDKNLHGNSTVYAQARQC